MDNKNGITTFNINTGMTHKNESVEDILKRTGVEVKLEPTPIQKLADALMEMDGAAHETMQLLVDCIIELDERITAIEGGGTDDSVS